MATTTNETTSKEPFYYQLSSSENHSEALFSFFIMLHSTTERFLLFLSLRNEY